MTGKKTRKGKSKESSSAYFEKLRPRFLDWTPPTEEEKALEVKARQQAREDELKRVTELAKTRDAEKAVTRKRNPKAIVIKKSRGPG